MIRIIHTNDIHCNLEESKDKGIIRFPKVLRFVKEERARADKEGYNVLFMDAGDFLSGTSACDIGYGEFGIKSINYAKYDAITIGNRFWDFGDENMKKNYGAIEDKSSLVVAKVKYNNQQNPVQFNPYMIKVINGIRVGIFGLTIQNVIFSDTSDENIKNLKIDDDVVEISKTTVNKLRNEEHCDVIILISHLGYKQNKITSDYLAENFNGIDVIIDGHTHTEIFNGAMYLNNDYQTLIAQTGSFLKHVGITDILVDESNQVIGKKSKLLNYDDFDEYQPDEEIEKILNENNEKKGRLYLEKWAK